MFTGGHHWSGSDPSLDTDTDCLTYKDTKLHVRDMRYSISVSDINKSSNKTVTTTTLTTEVYYSPSARLLPANSNINSISISLFIM